MREYRRRRALWKSWLNRKFKVLRVSRHTQLITCSCGPYKLAYILNQCLDRFELPEENLSHDSSSSVGTRSPKPGPFIDERPTLHPPAPCPPVMEHYEDPQASLITAPDIESTPLTPPAEELVKLPIRPASTASQVLIVDDNAINRSVSRSTWKLSIKLTSLEQLLVAFMKKHKYQYQEAENGLEALEMYQRHPYTFKIVLMDLSMPGKSI
jgi:hypothetical protein